MTTLNAISDRPSSRAVSTLAALAERLSRETVIRQGESLAKHTTLRIGGPADLYVEPASESDLAAVLEFCGHHALAFFVLGRGSNLLVRDGGFRGVVICLAHPEFGRIVVANERLMCGAGAKLKQVVMEAKRHRLSGLEFLEGIPGSVGGALRMNAGAMGAATFDVIESVRFMDPSGRIQEKPARELPLEYRSCPLLQSSIALGAVFKGTPAPLEEIQQRMNEFNERRWGSQPASPSAGCIFKNPAAMPAGKLIDELGMKGARVGGAIVSAEHANFIINDGTATAHDFLELIAIIKARARDERGIELHAEVEIVGED